ncbi:SDR family oxidoreductase [Sandarakinorhabdus sp.]|uniref:SDR family oxidoreductase n=1 Tax=Sandarakinorhabdus sp. TaxID=1916663 RepID=UPI00333FE358
MTATTKTKGDKPVPETQAGRLSGKVALITGAAGNLGGSIVRRYLNEGATVVMSGRDATRTTAALEAALADTGANPANASIVTMDGADIESVRAGIAEVVARHGRIDVLVNNAGSAGPKQVLGDLPLLPGELDGTPDSETVGDAARNIMVVAWNLVRAAASAMGEGGSIINVSTIFSRTDYFGRAAYTVPKAALNILSKGLARELGVRGIRVNQLYPGPIASERIRTVFAAMDKLKGDESGSTANHFFNLMALERSVGGEPKAKTFPTPADIAHACVFLGSDESAAFAAHDFEVTHGMAVPLESRSEFLHRPDLRAIDGMGHNILISAGNQLDDALAMAGLFAGQGARVLVGFHAQAALDDAMERLPPGVAAARFPRHDHNSMDEALAEFTASNGPIDSAVILPTRGPGYFTGALAEAGDAFVERFVDDELEGSIAVARTLDRYWQAPHDLPGDPRVLFITNPDDGAGNGWADVGRAAIEELLRVWRDEARVALEQARSPRAVWGNQIVRFGNAEPENRDFAAGHAARLLMGGRRIEPINLYIPASIAKATGARRALAGTAENITGLHLGKVALITGGSAGIGGALARLLALAGAKVMMVARRASELDAARERIVGELQDIGFAGVERRVRTLANIDVADMKSLQHAVDETVRAFGRIDYLINNAGVSGAEEMAVDMDIAAFRHTQFANLISNYALMHMVVPMMRAQGSGYILNVSSYFGGEKYLAVSYPNRTDYAVSKAGQRAMVESMARHLGPQIQINAIAPGPVDGDRLAGLGGKPGLFERRGRLILENKRLNAVHAAVIRSVRAGGSVAQILGRLARNDSVQLSHDRSNPQPLRDLALACAREGDESCCWDRYILTPPLAAKLLKRLRLGGWLIGTDWQTRDADWLLRVPPDDVPWLPVAQIGREAAKVRGGVLSQLHLGKMPTETEVAQATVFFLADRAVSGETFMPSGGLNVERSHTERELFGSPKAERLAQMGGKTVWLVGEHLADYLGAAAQGFLDCDVARVVLITATAAGADAIRRHIGEGGDRVVSLVIDGDIEVAIDTALANWGHPTTIVSTPLKALPDQLFDADRPLDGDGFADVVDSNLTHHFRIARKVSLFDDCQLVLVSPDVPMGEGAKGAFALANFVKTTLHAFTATIAVENERLVHEVAVNQINLTRRVRSEEPKNSAEHEEEVRRFARAVLLAGAPLPDAEDSRYRSRIYRGMSLTV